MDKFYTQLISMLSRSFSGSTQSGFEVITKGWHLIGHTLCHFMLNYTLKGCEQIHIQVAGGLNIFHDLVGRMSCRTIAETEFMFNSGSKIKLFPVKTIPKTIDEFPADHDRAKLRFPPNIGECCDKYDPNWTENVKRTAPRPYPTGCFFDDLRRKHGHELILKMLECGKRVGIADKMFLGFGNVLGYVIMGDFLPKDDDVDMCIIADDIPQEQRHQYLMECKKAGLCDNRMRGPEMINSKYCWFSIGEKSPFTEHGVKSCNWFWFEFGGYMWHSKGKMWIGRRDLSDKYATAKGIPVSIFKNQLKKVNFGGIEVQVPANIGRCLDWWYGGWVKREQESSRITALLVMPHENDRKTWYIERR